MASEKQIEANRLNAQKSTGPKSTEGKSIAALNSIKHGLRTNRILIKSEDPAQFDGHRASLLEELAPVGPMETILANRIIALTWQLDRASRLQACTLNSLYSKQDNQNTEQRKLRPMEYLSVALSDELGISEEEHYRIVDEVGYEGWEKHIDNLLFKRQLQDLYSEDPQQRDDNTLGEVIFADFSQTRALERLVMYERRIENSLYKTRLEFENIQRRRKTKEEKEVSHETPSTGHVNSVMSGI